MNDVKPIPLHQKQGKNPLVVNLRPSCIQSILVHPRGYKVVGTIRRGMNLGLLAIAPDGKFVRVNGSYVEQLIQRAVCDAIRRCLDPHPIRAQLIAISRRNKLPSAMPLVSIRKRRSFLNPEVNVCLDRRFIPVSCTAY